MRISIFLVMGALQVMMSCSPDDRLDGFDAQAFRDDPDGCNGTRLEMQQEIKASTSDLIGWGQRELVRTLGLPDEEELYRRNMRFYRYYLSPSPLCDLPAAQQSESTVMLEIRFNALDQVGEAYVLKK